MACFEGNKAAPEMEMEKQMGGCMAGFLHLFDRHHLLAGKHVSPSRRLPPPASPQVEEIRAWTPEVEMAVVEEKRPLLPLPVFEEGARSAWKLRDSPRLSLDSRIEAGSPADDQQQQLRRAPSVVARLMGLDALPAETNTAERRRSASESRVPRALLDDVDDNSFPTPSPAAVEGPPETAKARRSFLDIFPPGPEKGTIGNAVVGAIEKKFRLKGVGLDEANDLEMLRQILEAVHLKGLLHSPAPEVKRTKPVKSPRRVSERSPPSSPSKCRPKSIRRAAEPISPPPARTRRASSSKQLGPNATPACRKVSPEKISPAPDDQSSTTTTMSEGQCDGERGLMEGTKEGRSVRITETTTHDQTSPVSVLDASLYKEDDSSHSPQLIPSKRCLLFHDEEDGRWSSATSPEMFASGDFLYVAEVLRAMGRHRPFFADGDSELFALMEKRFASDASKLHRRLLFDAVAEIASRESGLPAALSARRPEWVWAEMERLMRRPPAVDVCEFVRGVLERDVAAGGGWVESLEGTAAVVLDVERLVFKDLVQEAIGDFALLGRRRRACQRRRRRRLEGNRSFNPKRPI